ncbi:MAG: hypothetical protein PHH14_07605 [Candidatus Margulisbacteria bacterium]|nr:hypothetical protein [Candidatus Margulisiibacteriota bacterium]
MNKRGVTLVDSLVAAAIMVMLVSVFAQAIAVAKKELAASGKKMTALYEVRSLMEKAMATPFASLPSLQGEQVAVSSLGPDSYLITVTVDWLPNRPPLKLCAMRFDQ